MKRTLKKAERMMQIEQLLLAHPMGLTRVALARRLGVHRSTIWRDINDLSALLPIWEDGDILGIDRDAYLINTGLTIHESMAVHLAIRLLASNSKNSNPHASAVVRKLSKSLNHYSPQIAKHLKASAQIAEKHNAGQSPQLLHVLETLTRSWADGVKAKIWFELDGRLQQRTFSPYFIEPYRLDQTTHVMGLQEPENEQRIVDIARIKKAELSSDSYDIPEDFDATAYHPDAANDQPHDKNDAVTEVIIRFSPHVAQQVQATHWHPSQQFSHLSDGSVLMQLHMNDPQSLTSWIQSWGAGCEVMAPQSLRTAIASEAQALARLYGHSQENRVPNYVVRAANNGRFSHSQGAAASF